MTAPTQGFGEVKPTPSRASSSARRKKSSSVWRDVATTQALLHHEDIFAALRAGSGAKKSKIEGLLSSGRKTSVGIFFRLCDGRATSTFWAATNWDQPVSIGVSRGLRLATAEATQKIGQGLEQRATRLRLVHESS